MKAKKITMGLVVALAIVAGVSQKDGSPSVDGDKLSADEIRYEYSDPKFSFPYSKEAKATIAEDGPNGTAIISVRNNLATGSEFQIAITLEEDSSPLTIERINNDLPDLQTIGARNISVAGTQAVAFTVIEGGQGTAEVWFVREGWLYQITAYNNEASRAMAEKAVAGWKF